VRSRLNRFLCGTLLFIFFFVWNKKEVKSLACFEKVVLPGKHV
jgi:hypothetical protein